MTFSPGIPYVPASATGAKAIIVFDEKMSKAPLEQQNKSYPWRVVRCRVAWRRYEWCVFRIRTGQVKSKGIQSYQAENCSMADGQTHDDWLPYQK